MQVFYYKKHICRLLILCLAVISILSFDTKKTYARSISLADAEPVDSNTYRELYFINQRLDNSNMTPADCRMLSVYYEKVDFKYAKRIEIIPESKVENCCIGGDGGSAIFKTTLNVSGLEELTGTTSCELNPNTGWDTGTVNIKQEVGSIKMCACTSHNKITNIITYFYVYKQTPILTLNPINSKADEGGTVSMKVNGSYTRGYQWQVEKDGNYVNIKDGDNANGSSYSGTGTQQLTITNLTAADNGTKYRCLLKATGKVYVESGSARVDVNIKSTPTPTPSPTPTPTEEVTPTPSPLPTVAPTEAPVPTAVPSQEVIPTKVPENNTGSEAILAPGEAGTSSGKASSSSVYVPQSGNVTQIIPNSSTSVTKPVEDTLTSGESPNEATKVTILTDTKDKEDTAALDLIASGAQGLDKAAKGTKSNTTNTSGNGSSNTPASSSAMPASSTAKTVMKNGVLYIIDDEEDMNSQMEEEAEEKEEEEFELDNAYSAADLAIGNEGEISGEKRLSIGFYLGLLAFFIIGLILLLFFLFFGVIVEGECEESDDVFDLYAIRLVYRKDGNWCVNLKEIFDENAVARLRLGLIFALIFKEWDITCNCLGIYQGEVKGQIGGQVLLYRKEVKRSI